MVNALAAKPVPGIKGDPTRDPSGAEDAHLTAAGEDADRPAGMLAAERAVVERPARGSAHQTLLSSLFPQTMPLPPRVQVCVTDPPTHQSVCLSVGLSVHPAIHLQTFIDSHGRLGTMLSLGDAEMAFGAFALIPRHGKCTA